MTDTPAGVGRLSLTMADCPDAVGGFLAALLGVGVNGSEPGRVPPNVPGHPFCLVTV